MKLMLNLGCGNTFHPKWINIDLVPSSSQVKAFDVRKPLPYKSNFFDCIYSSHLLEHLNEEEGVFLLQEAHRVLKTNGIIRLVVPDLEIITELYSQYLKEGWKNKENKDAIFFQKYDWIKTELLDQLVREKNGGRMKILIQKYSNIRTFIRDRIGQEADEIIYKNAKSARQRVSTLLKIPILRYIEYLRYSILLTLAFLIGGKKYTHLVSAGYFRASGEVHKTMYDKYNLYTVLKRLGFHSISVKTAFTSNIPRFSSYNLDIIKEKIRKPDSLYIEAIK